jgi:membrane-bound lytic murein transglycosylase F
MLKRLTYYILFFPFLTSCNFHSRQPDSVHLEQDFEEIREKGKITVLTDYSSTDYFIYRGQPLGFQYEMLQQLANHLAVKLEVLVTRDLSESFEMLRSGEADLIAQNLTITKNRLQMVDFTIPFIQTRQVLVQRKPDDWKKMKPQDAEAYLLRSPDELIGKTIHVAAGTAYITRLKNLSEEIGGDIHVIESDESTEQLIELVSQGQIPYTVSDEISASVNSRYYPNVDISTPVSLQQNMAWAVRKGSTTLLQELNSWLESFSQTPKYKTIYARYYKSGHTADMFMSDFYAINTGRISPYDDDIRKYSDELGWDWRLLASLIYQESRFKINVTSWAGAWGLMQLMPVTARQFGIDSISSPRDQIRAGSQYITWLNEQFSDITDPEERIKFILASYNIGQGHVIDARRLAEKNHDDPNKWDDHVARYLLLKADPKYYNDPVVRYGYCRGNETSRYVAEILERYEHYKNIVGK